MTAPRQASASGSRQDRGQFLTVKNVKYEASGYRTMAYDTVTVCASKWSVECRQPWGFKAIRDAFKIIFLEVIKNFSHCNISFTEVLVFRHTCICAAEKMSSAAVD